MDEQAWNRAKEMAETKDGKAIVEAIYLLCKQVTRDASKIEETVGMIEMNTMDKS